MPDMPTNSPADELLQLMEKNASAGDEFAEFAELALTDAEFVEKLANAVEQINDDGLGYAPTKVASAHTDTLDQLTERALRDSGALLDPEDALSAIMDGAVAHSAPAEKFASSLHAELLGAAKAAPAEIDDSYDLDSEVDAALGAPSDDLIADLRNAAANEEA
jgi:hypothetical protein